MSFNFASLSSNFCFKAAKATSRSASEYGADDGLYNCGHQALNVKTLAGHHSSSIDTVSEMGIDRTAIISGIGVLAMKYTSLVHTQKNGRMKAIIS